MAVVSDDDPGNTAICIIIIILIIIIVVTIMSTIMSTIVEITPHLPLGTQLCFAVFSPRHPLGSQLAASQ